MSNAENADRQPLPPDAGDNAPSAASSDAVLRAAPPRRSSRAAVDDLARAAREYYARRMAPSVKRAAESARAGVTRAWELLRRARPAPPDALPTPAAQLWRWSPLVTPLALEAILLLLGFSLIGHHAAHGATITRAQVRTLALVLLGLGVVLAAALYVARDVGTWTLALLLGVSASLIATVYVLLGRNPALAVALLLLAAGATFLRLHRVPANTVQVTTLLGKFHRTLLPGQRLLFPGERLLAALPTGERRITALAAPMAPGAARPTATLVYQLAPREADRVARMGSGWERTLQRALARALRDEMEQRHAPSGAQTAPTPSDDARELRRGLEQRLDQLAPRWGLRVVRVELRDVAPTQEDATAQEIDPTEMGEQLAALFLQARQSRQRPVPPALPAQSPPAAPRTPPRQAIPSPPAAPAAPAVPPAVARHSTQPLPAAPLDDDPTIALDASDPALPSNTGPVSSGAPASPPRPLSRLARLASGFHLPGGRAPGAPEAHADAADDAQDDSDERAGASAATASSPEVLASAYEAVREGRISDPYTIRQIADRFAELAVTSAPETDPGFDAEAAAHILRQRAEELALERGDPLDGMADQQPPSGAPPRAPRRVERDDNVTSGG